MEGSTNLYYKPAWNAVSGQTSALLRDFREVQRQTTLSARIKTAESLQKVCMESMAKSLKRSTGYPTRETISTGFYWFIKSLDGIENFTHGNPMFSNSATLMDGDNPVISLVNLPVFGKIVCAEPDQGLSSNLGKHCVSRNIDFFRSYIVGDTLETHNIGSTSISYVYTAYGYYDGFILNLDELELRIARLFITEGGGKFSRIGNRAIGSNTFLHENIRDFVLNKTLSETDRGISFCCGPTQKTPGWPAKIYDQALIGRSHRSSPGISRIQEVQSLIRDILMIPKSHEILLLNGSATGAIECAFFNFLGHRPIQNCAYDVFGKRWASEIENMLKHSKHINHEKVFLRHLDYKNYTGGDKVNYENQADLNSDLVFVYTGTSNGRRWQAHHLLKEYAKSSSLTICDATSALFAETMPWSYLDITCGSFQKALGAEAGLGLIILSPKAIKQLQDSNRVFLPPRILRLDPKVVDEVVHGKLINTISMLNLEEILHNLRWAHSSGGLKFLQRQCEENQKYILNNIPEGLELVLPENAARALTVLCLQTKDVTLRNWDHVRAIAAKAENLGVYEIAGHPEEIPCWRFWTGPTVHNLPRGFNIFTQVLQQG